MEFVHQEIIGETILINPGNCGSNLETFVRVHEILRELGKKRVLQPFLKKAAKAKRLIQDHGSGLLMLAFLAMQGKFVQQFFFLGSERTLAQLFLKLIHWHTVRCDEGKEPCQDSDEPQNGYAGVNESSEASHLSGLFSKVSEIPSQSSSELAPKHH
ncbi:hypothetical protein KJ068_19085 [bacterium]|nr:hypothetical protein [bacterium]